MKLKTAKLLSDVVAVVFANIIVSLIYFGVYSLVAAIGFPTVAKVIAVIGGVIVVGNFVKLIVTIVKK